MEESAWTEVSALAAAAPYPVEVLSTDPERASACLTALGITTRSWLGAVVANSGGLVIDHGWLRVLGGGHDGLPEVAADDGRLVVAFDVMGGQFAWLSTEPGARPTVHYFGPEDLAWQDLEFGYGDWLHAMLAGAVTQFYAGLRWPGWEAEVAGVALDEGISAVPPPWTREGKDLSVVSRRPIRLTELVSVQQETARQLGFL
ncbi:DUF2625 family protein [Couchioplanes caeruleus]|uniref:DUF2625 domain-containing protein n=2 Tax=Couchioplanes caeruleus TaxID=56438 RepID=A0A1K0FZB5_9ACTN|nr:DUF2625 family protein [Couchioplanes caeruleus]OJF10410.1 hypothetical protein BG844_32275 [Couchioplanes caeruleus subsp. caeruleus]ROP29799.1 uncharacterized protein DUF2625 [Couchioplanes caeruleus]